MINLFDQTIKNNKIIYENIRKIAAGKGDDYTTDYSLDYAYFRDMYKMIAVDLSKQQALDSDCKAIQQINFTANLERARNTRIFFILGEARNCLRIYLKILIWEYNFKIKRMTRSFIFR